MKKILALSVFALVGLAGCSTMNQSAPSNYAGPSVSSCLKAETEVGDTITGSSTTTRILGIFKFGDSEFADGVGYGIGGFSLGFSDAEDAKSAAAFKAIKQANADTVVAPKYVVSEYNFLGLYKTTSATITGKAGKTGKITSAECK
jgi:hypothetical protein